MLDSQPVAEDHWPDILVMHMMRWRMMKIHLRKTHHPTVEVVQEHHLEAAAQAADGPVTMMR